MATRYSKCSQCGSNHTGKIRYSEPNILYPVDENFCYGGCCLTSESPKYFCSECDHEGSKNEVLIKTYLEIDNIVISIGGYWSGTYTVDIDLNQRKLKWTHIHAGEDAVFEKSLRNGTVNKLRELLIDINLLNWKTEYIDSEILDGTQWSIVVRKNNNTKEINGSNVYPNDWNRLVREIKKITGKPFH